MLRPFTKGDKGEEGTLGDLVLGPNVSILRAM